MGRAFTLLAKVSFLLVLLQIGYGLKCYRCLGKPGEECDNPKKNPNLVEVCSNATHGVCVTENITFVGSYQLTRSCGLRDACGAVRGINHNVTCDTCEKDLCNSSSNVRPTFLFSFITLFFTYLLL